MSVLDSRSRRFRGQPLSILNPGSHPKKLVGTSGLRAPPSDRDLSLWCLRHDRSRRRPPEFDGCRPCRRAPPRRSGRFPALPYPSWRCGQCTPDCRWPQSDKSRGFGGKATRESPTSLDENLNPQLSIHGSSAESAGGFSGAWAPVFQGREGKAPPSLGSGADALDAPSARLSLVRLRPRRA